MSYWIKTELEVEIPELKTRVCWMWKEKNKLMACKGSF